MGEPERHSSRDLATGSKSSSSGARGGVGARDRAITVLLVDARSWRRESYAQALTCAGREVRVLGFTDVADAAQSPVQSDATLVMLNLEGVSLAGSEVLDRIATARSSLPGLPIVVVSDSTEAADILKLIEHGVSGFLPISLELQRVIDVLRLVAAGGTFIPAEPVLADIENIAAPTAPQEPSPEGDALQNATTTTESSPASDHQALIAALENLTPRERKVLDQLRQGQSNKLIARALDVSEATIKVHVGNIMKKLRVSNRTQVALLVESLDEDLHRSGDGPKSASDF